MSSKLTVTIATGCSDVSLIKYAKAASENIGGMPASPREITADGVLSRVGIRFRSHTVFCLCKEPAPAKKIEFLVYDSGDTSHVPLVRGYRHSYQGINTRPCLQGPFEACL